MEIKKIFKIIITSFFVFLMPYCAQGSELYTSLTDEVNNKIFPKEHNDFTIYFPGSYASEIYDAQIELIRILEKSRTHFAFDFFSYLSASYFYVKYSENKITSQEDFLFCTDVNYIIYNKPIMSLFKLNSMLLDLVFSERAIPMTPISSTSIRSGSILKLFVEYHYNDAKLTEDINRAFHIRETDNFEANWTEIVPRLAKKQFNSDENYDFLIFNELVEFYRSCKNPLMVFPNNADVVGMNNRIVNIQKSKVKTHVKVLIGDLPDKNNDKTYKIGVFIGSGKILNIDSDTGEKFSFDFKNNLKALPCSKNYHIVYPSKEIEFIFYEWVGYNKCVKHVIKSTEFDVLFYVPRIGAKEKRFVF